MQFIFLVNCGQPFWSGTRDWHA